MFAIDTNLLVYAHNEDSDFNDKASEFLEKVLNERDDNGNLSVCLPSQVLTEFVKINRKSLKKPLSLLQAIDIVNDYQKADIRIVYQRETQIETFLELLRSFTTRKKVFDVALAATLKDNGITGLYTANVDDFKEFDFLKVINPLE